MQLKTIVLEASAAVAVMHVAAWLLWPLLARKSARVRHLTSSLVGLLLPLVGLSIQRDAKIARVLIAILGMILGARLYSYWRSERLAGFADYVRFLSFALLSPHLVYSPAGFAAHQRAPFVREILRMLVAGAVVGIAVFVTYRILRTELAMRSWLVNYLIVVAAFSLIMQALGQIGWAGWQLLGIRSKPLVDNIWLSRTPADFWRRWSWPPHAWLNRYVYKPWGGRAHAKRAVFAAFLISGLAHEAMAGIGLGRVTGHQTAFFLVSGLGVMASEPLERLAGWGLPGEIVMRFATIVFMLASGVLMFATFNDFMPLLFHQPAWLAW